MITSTPPPPALPLFVCSHLFTRVCVCVFDDGGATGVGQVTFFHLFHHCSITVIVGSVLPFDFNGDMYLPIMLNSIVHVLVYLHYVLTALRRHSWWSRHLTSLQLAQFVVIFVQSAAALYYGPSCGSPDFVK
ncbi:unnamed protein product, partial [Laminaria digitata]